MQRRPHCRLAPMRGCTASSGGQRTLKTLWPAKNPSRPDFERQKEDLRAQERRQPNGKLADRAGARANNSNHRRVQTTGVFVCVTGVSGSGNSSLINEIVCRTWSGTQPRKRKAGQSAGIEGIGTWTGGRHRPVPNRAHAAVQPATYTVRFR
jgi:excinuclease UvrABC ATPase subunit